MAEPDIASVVLGQTATPDWANAVAAAINSIDNRTTAVEAWNAGSRLTSVESVNTTQNSRLTTLETAVGARHNVVYTPGETIANGDSVLWAQQVFRQGIGTVEDYSYFETQSAGVYAISWAATIASNWRTKLVIASAVRAIGVDDGGSSTTYGSWTGYIGNGQRIWVIGAGATGPTAGPTAGYIHIFKVANGG